MRGLLASSSCLLLLSGCSLVKLSEDIKQENCSTDADCEVLNERGADDFDPCELWQCSPASKLCEFTALDQDHDGYTPMTVDFKGDELMCEVAAAKQDCDDDSAARKPGGKERCDDLDNDCDGQVDEGALVPSQQVAVMFTEGNAEGVGDLAYAVEPGTGKVALAYSLNRATNSVPGFTLLDNQLPAGATASELRPSNSMRKLFADSLGIGALGDGKFAVAFFNGNGNRLVAGTVQDDPGSAPVLEASDSVMDQGLHCSADEDCSMSVLRQTQTPAVAGLGNDVVVAYVRAQADPSRSCDDKGDGVPAHPLLANLLSISTGGLDEQTDAAVSIADSSALDAPALLGIPAAVSGAEAFGWLVAYIDEGGAIVLRRLTRDGSTLQVSDPLLTLSNSSARHSNVRLALGPKTGGGYVVGLTFQRGCIVAARVGMALLTVSASASMANVKQLGEVIMVGGSANESQPAIAYAAGRDVWGVTYRDTLGLRARVITAAGQLLGDAPYELLKAAKAGADTRELLLAPVLVPSTSDGWFGALAYTRRTGATPMAFESSSLASCAKQD